MLDQEVRKWQTVLQKIIQSPKERQRLASALGINVITLTRWAKENSNPQRSYLTRLVQVVQPQQRAELLIALLDAYPDMQEKLLAEASEVVPSAFFRQLPRIEPRLLKACSSGKSVRLCSTRRSGCSTRTTWAWLLLLCSVCRQLRGRSAVCASMEAAELSPGFRT